VETAVIMLWAERDRPSGLL